MFCSQCGKPLNADSKFCNSCGAKQEQEIQQSNPAQSTQAVDKWAVGQKVFVSDLHEGGDGGTYTCCSITAINENTVCVELYDEDDGGEITEDFGDWVALSEIVSVSYALNNMRLKHKRILEANDDDEEVFMFQSCELVSEKPLTVRYNDGITEEAKLSNIIAEATPKQMTSPAQQQSYPVQQAAVSQSKPQAGSYPAANQPRDPNNRWIVEYESTIKQYLAAGYLVKTPSFWSDATPTGYTELIGKRKYGTILFCIALSLLAVTMVITIPLLIATLWDERESNRTVVIRVVYEEYVNDCILATGWLEECGVFASGNTITKQMERE